VYALVALAVALAAETEPPPSDDAALVDVTVIDVTVDVARARALLERKLRELGFPRGVEKRNKTVFHHRTPWRPSVHLMHDGRAEIRRGVARFNMFGIGFDRAVPGKLNVCTGALLEGEQDAVIIPAACLEPDAWFAGKRVVHNAQGEVIAKLTPYLHAWQDAVAADAFRQRVDVEIPSRLRRMLDEAPTREAGYAEVVAWGCTRTDTREGEEARGVAADVLGAAFPTLHLNGDVDWRELCGAEQQ
jgi:hypothetical protein